MMRISAFMYVTPCSLDDMYRSCTVGRSVSTVTDVFT
jgi:hypothetical protein